MFAFSCEQTPAPMTYDNVTEDPLFKEYSDDMQTLLVDVKPKQDLNLDPGTTKEQIISEFENSKDIKHTLGKYVDNPEVYIERIRTSYMKAQVLQKRYPEVMQVGFNYSSIVTTNKLANPSIFANLGPEADKACYRQFETDIAECQAIAAIGAVGCGLSSWTLVGALGCGAAVIAVRATCGYFAARTMDNCTIANRDNP